MKVDDHGQPVIRTFNAARLNDRMIDELIGLCRGDLLDGAISELEADRLSKVADASDCGSLAESKRRPEDEDWRLKAQEPMERVARLRHLVWICEPLPSEYHVAQQPISKVCCFDRRSRGSNA